ncbi:MAG: glycoside hydrolase family 13 protein [Lachnospiraceae bacterium]|nr:glycoside hydrolase family 13 protein [Lachnospiraceae bacterium]
MRVYESLNVKAIFFDETENFVFPMEALESDLVALRLRTAKDGADYAAIIVDGLEIPMELSTKGEVFDYYRGFLPYSQNAQSYFFKVQKNGETVFWTKSGARQNKSEGFPFVMLRNFKTPDWAKGAFTYQIFTDRFFNGDFSNDVKTDEYTYLNQNVSAASDWYALPKINDVGNFYGGDLEGVIKKLDYIASLGVKAIYFNPLFVSPSNHKYDIQDYDHIDPHFGAIASDGGERLCGKTNEHASMYIKRTTDETNLKASDSVFITLVRLAHARGIKIILDGVFNHCGAFHKWMDREKIYGKGYPLGAYRSQNSIYRNYFKWLDSERNVYESWWGHENHPKLNYEGSHSLYEYIMSVAAKWVSPPYSADGWRLDVAADLGSSVQFNHRFWRDFRKAVKTANPEAIIIAENYGDSSQWLKGGEWDTIMNYDAFMEPVTWFLTGMEKHSDFFNPELLNNGKAFEKTMTENMAKINISSMLAAMNQLSNHDHSRFLTRTNKTPGRFPKKDQASAEEGINKGIFREGVIIQMTWMGAPSLYYGDEAGLCGWTDPDNRRTYPWGREDDSLIELYRKAGEIHNKNISLKKGSLMFLKTDTGILSYCRFFDDELILVAVNNNDTSKTILDIPFWRAGNFGENFISLIQTDESGFSCERKVYKSQGGKLDITLPSFGSIVLKNTGIKKWK